MSQDCPRSCLLGREEVAVSSGPWARQRTQNRLPWYPSRGRLGGSSREGFSPVSTGPQGALSPLTTRMGQRSRTRAEAHGRDVQQEDGAWEALSSQSLGLLATTQDAARPSPSAGPFSPGVRAQSRCLPQGLPRVLSNPAGLHDGCADPHHLSALLGWDKRLLLAGSPGFSLKLLWPISPPLWFSAPFLTSLLLHVPQAIAGLLPIAKMADP